MMTLITLLALTPPILWNARHDWVSFHHVATQTSGGLGHGDFFAFVGAQFGVVNPMLALLMIAAAWTTVRQTRQDQKNAIEKKVSGSFSFESHSRGMLFLLVIGGSFFYRLPSGFDHRKSADQLARAGVFHAADSGGLFSSRRIGNRPAGFLLPH